MGGKVTRRVGVLLGSVGLWGCIAPPPESAERIEQVRAEGQAVSEALVAVETRLLANQGNLELWQELARRHQHVSELACANHAEHMEAMARFYEREEQRSRRLKKRRRVTRTHMVSQVDREGRRQGAAKQ